MSIDTSVPYTISAPANVDGRGGVAVLNDTTSANFVGFLDDLQMGPAIRTSMDNISEGHGAAFGPFYYGPLSFTMEIIVSRAANYAASNARLDKLLRATNAMQADGSIVFTENGSVAKLLSFRREQPVRGPDKEARVLFAGICADARILSNTLNSASPGTITNAGNVGASPTFVLTSPTNTITLTNSTTSQTLTLTGLSGAGTVTVDFFARTVTATNAPTYRAGAVSWPSSVWWELIPGSNSVSVSGAGGTVKWRDSWLN